MNGVPGVTPGALGLGHRAFDRLRRVRLGHRYLPQPPAGRGTARAGAEPAAAQRHPADRPHQFDHGPDSPDRGDVEDGLADGSARGRRLRDQAAAACACPASRRSSRSAARSASTGLRRMPPALRALGVTLRAGRAGAPAVRHQHRRRLHRPERPRISDPQYRPYDQPRGSAQHRRRHRSRGARSFCGRWRTSTSRPRSSAATPATWASPPSSSRSRSSPMSTRCS